jgi:hypothetical protein
MPPSPSPKDDIKALMKQAAPERIPEIEALWERYNPDISMVADAKHITLNANKDRIEFNLKTIEVFWLIGFSGWKAIECYSPLVICSAACGQKIADLIAGDNMLSEVERAYKERRAAAQTLIDAVDPTAAPWPPDLPRVSLRDAVDDPQFKAAFDLTWSSFAFSLFYEFRHVMLDGDDSRHADLREEELACDVWARDFLTANIAAFAEANCRDYHEVLRRRAMAFAMAALIFHEITPIWEHGGNRCYFSVASRMQAILDNTPLPENDDFWIFSASVLIGIYRQKNAPIGAPALSPKELTQYLIENL